MRLASLLLVAAWAVMGLPVPASAQGKHYRVGVLAPSSLSIRLIREQTLPELAKDGFVEGRNLVVETRAVDGAPERLPALASELVALGVDALVAVADPSIRAALAATRSTPVIMAFGSDDPVVAGFADSLAKPGKNVTGTVILARELDAKRMQILIEAVPSARRVAALTEPTIRDDATAPIRDVAEKMGVEFVGAFPAARPEDYAAAFARMKAAGVQAVLVAATPTFYRDVQQVAPLATEAKMPIICQWREMADAGCMLAYGPLYRDLRRRTAYYLARVLNGIPPGDLPIEQPSRFDLTVNVRSSRDIGLELPQFLVLRADEVIE
jgi:putative tryptophan/tyrosine transport system substrate-binding protein